MTTWLAVRCYRSCDDGYRGMDRCNTCGCTGSQLVHKKSGDRYPNTEKGWMDMALAHPEVNEDKADPVCGEGGER